MTDQDLKTLIETTAAAALAAGQSIGICTGLPSIAIETSQEDYYFQEHAAQELIDNCPAFVALEDWLLWQAQGW